MSRSQLGQDLLALETFGYQKDLYFVEVGASDGIVFSNTALLEKEYEWKGLCIEPIPDMYARLVQNRSCHCMDKAVYSVSGQKVNFSVRADTLLSGITSCIDSHLSARDQSIIKVETITLTDALDQVGAPSFIHYLSIDTEGSELEVLKGIDFSKYTFGLVNIEHNYVEPRRTDMRLFLESKGYAFHSENQWDDNYKYNLLEM